MNDTVTRALLLIFYAFILARAARDVARMRRWSLSA